MIALVNATSSTFCICAGLQQRPTFHEFPTPFGQNRDEAFAVAPRRPIRTGPFAPNPTAQRVKVDHDRAQRFLPVYPVGMWRMKVRLIPPAMIVSVVSPAVAVPSRDRSRSRRTAGPCPCPRLRRHRSLRLVPPRRSFRPRRWCRRVPPRRSFRPRRRCPLFLPLRSFPRCPSSRRVPRRRPFLPRPSSRPAPSLRPRRCPRRSRAAGGPAAPCPAGRPRASRGAGGSRAGRAAGARYAARPAAAVAGRSASGDRERHHRDGKRPEPPVAPVTFIPFRRPEFVSIAASLSMCPLYVADHRTLIVDMSTSWLTNHLTAEAGGRPREAALFVVGARGLPRARRAACG